MTREPRVWVVDRVERGVVVLVADDSGEVIEVPADVLPFDAREGDLLRITPGAGADGAPDWAAAEIDVELRRERLEEARGVIDELRKRDPRGDVEL